MTDPFVITMTPYLELLALFSIFTFFGSLIIIPGYVKRMPQSFFLHYTSQPPCPVQSLTFILLLIIRNIFGLFLILAGMLMLFLPGQGVITIVIGLLFVNFPRKRNLIFHLICLRSIQISLNWARKKVKKQPFLWPENCQK